MTRNHRRCTYLYLSGVILLIVLLVVNLAATMLPWRVTKRDAGHENISRVSDRTLDFLANLQEDVNVYWLCEDGMTDYATELFLTRYEEASDRVKVRIVDTTDQPDFASQYLDSGSTLSNYSLIIESESRVTVLDFTDLYLFSNDVLQAALGVTYLTATQLSYYMTYYSSVLKESVTSRYFQGESQLTGAIDYVTAERVPHGYILTGHGETVPTGTLLGALGSYGVRSLDLQQAGGIPEDADCLILYAPELDLTEAEDSAIRAFLAAGGSFMLVTNPAHISDCPRAAELGSLYGMSALPGVVYDADEEFHAEKDSTYLLPMCNADHRVSAAIGQNFKVSMPTSHAISVSDQLPDGVYNLSSVLTTSEQAVRKSVDGMSEMGEPGKMSVAAAAEKSVPLADGSSKTGYFVWFGSSQAFTDSAAKATQNGNYYCFIAFFQYASTQFSSVYADIPPICLDGNALTVGSHTAVVWSVAVILALPAACLGVGLYIRARRRRGSV